MWDAGYVHDLSGCHGFCKECRKCELHSLVDEKPPTGVLILTRFRVRVKKNILLGPAHAGQGTKYARGHHAADLEAASGCAGTGLIETGRTPFAAVQGRLRSALGQQSACPALGQTRRSTATGRAFLPQSVRSPA